MSLDRDQLTTLHTVLKLGSFDRAADALGVTQPAISLRIRTLEDRVGLPLVLRGTPCVGTAAGRRLAQHAQSLALMETAAFRDLDLPLGSTRTQASVAVNADSLATWFPSVLPLLEDLSLDVHTDDQDHSANWLTSGDVSAAVTGTSKAAKGCDITPLGKQRYIATASPDFVKRWFADGVSTNTLMDAPQLVYSHKDQLQASWIKHVTGKTLFPPHHVIPSTHGFLRATRNGAAWAINPIDLIKKDLSDGTLVEIVPGSHLDVALFWQCNRHVKSALTPLENAVFKVAKEQLLQGP